MKMGAALLTAACALLLLTSLKAQTTQPTTQPAGLTLRGRVKAASTWDIQKPDLSRVVIYLASNPALNASNAPPPHGHATVAQKNKAFVPNFLVVPVGTDVEFPNWDNFDHNVFSISKAAPAFDLDRYPKGQSKTRTFEKVGVVQTFCNIHPEMRAIIFVTPTPCFTRADSEGKFQLSNIPPGRHEIVAWQERCGEQRQTVELREGELPEVSFVLSENRQNILPDDKPPRDTSYGIERGLGVKREVLNLPVVKDSHPALDPEK